MNAYKGRQYECRFVNKESKQVASIWIDCPDDTAAIAEAIAAAKLVRTEQMVGYVLRCGLRRVASVGW